MFLKKAIFYSPEPNFSRCVDYTPMGVTRIERRTGWGTYNLKKVSEASRQRLHKVIRSLPTNGSYITGRTRRYLFK